MKNIFMGLMMAAAAAAIAAPAVNAQTFKKAGFGVIVGDPIGGTAKLWLDEAYAVDLGVGFSGDTVMWGDLLYHMWNLLPQPEEGKLGVYIGAGPRLETRRDTEFGVRTIAGLTWRITRQPLEFFAEAGPVFRMTPSGGVGADGGIGVRFYLGN